jgi:hypothetical protein
MSRRGRSLLATAGTCVVMGLLPAAAVTPEPVDTAIGIASGQASAPRNCSSHSEDGLDQARTGSYTGNNFNCLGAPDASCGTAVY